MNNLTLLTYFLELGVSVCSAYALYTLIMFKVLSDPSGMYCTWRVWLSIMVCMSIFSFVLLFVQQTNMQMWVLSLRNLVGIIIISSILPTLYSTGVNSQCPIVKKYRALFISYLSLMISEMIVMIIVYNQHSL